MAVETTTSTQTTQIDPAIQPYLGYGLSEAQRLYQAGAALEAALLSKWGTPILSKAPELKGAK